MILSFRMPATQQSEATSLAAYTVRVKNRTTENFQLLGNAINGGDILPFLIEFIEATRTHINDSEAQLYLAAHTVTEDGRMVTGKVESGKYGSMTPIRSIKTGKDVHQQRPDEAAMFPFYFLFDLPADLDRGILILQKRGARGVRTVLTKALDARVEKLAPESQVIVRPLLSADVVKQYLQGGEITKLQFVKFELSTDVRNHYSSGARQVKGQMRLIASVSRNSSGLPVVDTIRQYLEKKVPLQGLFELEETKFSYDTIKLEVKLGNRRKTVDLGKLVIPRAPFDISQSVAFEHGHPKFEDVDKAARELIQDLRLEVYKGNGQN